MFSCWDIYVNVWLEGAKVPSAVVFFCHSSQAEMDTLGSILRDKVKGQNSTGHHL